ncbi:hypothetical protein BDB00DRAFT_386318 [Zychaea mexicana]|uniref:uncharacterized protein n=1 Tax=Zychaea mexicana TaxID=64656 RepID=UPI0022FDB50F|nr:uncharacterized protein BDB00DRAFT_386318 [Zychaea mexicana]KAI9493138.1 hypothetical protein BDB00DRAFT_386318 [Zychaea mexicana]
MGQDGFPIVEVLLQDDSAPPKEEEGRQQQQQRKRPREEDDATAANDRRGRGGSAGAAVVCTYMAAHGPHPPAEATPSRHHSRHGQNRGYGDLSSEDTRVYVLYLERTAFLFLLLKGRVDPARERENEEEKERRADGYRVCMGQTLGWRERRRKRERRKDSSEVSKMLLEWKEKGEERRGEERGKKKKHKINRVSLLSCGGVCYVASYSMSVDTWYCVPSTTYLVVLCIRVFKERERARAQSL